MKTDKENADAIIEYLIEHVYNTKDEIAQILEMTPEEFMLAVQYMKDKGTDINEGIRIDSYGVRVVFLK